MLKHVLDGWSGPCARLCQPYYSFSEEMSLVNGVLLKGQRIIVPSSMQSFMLSRLHMGIEKTRRTVREVMY